MVKKDRVLVFAGSGVGNCIETTPLIQALQSINYEVDVGLWPNYKFTYQIYNKLCNVYHRDNQINPNNYKYRITTYIGKRFSGNNINSNKIPLLDIKYPDSKIVGEIEYNMTAARFLGYKGKTPELYCPYSSKHGTRINDEKLIIINTLYKEEYKHWDKFKELGNELNTIQNIKIKVIDRMLPDISSIYPILADAYIIITAEGGMGWLSLSMKKRTIILSGKTIGNEHYGMRNYYKNSNANYIIKKDIKKISVKEVLDKLLELINKGVENEYK